VNELSLMAEQTCLENPTPTDSYAILI